ncbi:MAG: hypothetical protein ACRC68_18215 [Clostridium sp.]
MKKKLISLPIIFSIIILLYITLHITPQMSLRTYLFFTWHPVLAFTSSVQAYTHDASNENLNFYTFSPSPKGKFTGNDMLAYKTKKTGFIYISEHHGGG